MADRLEPTRQLALKVWWAFMWRAALGAVVSGFVVGMILGFLAQVLRLDSRTVENVSAVLGLGIGLAVSVEVMYRVLRKKFAGFELALIPRRD